MLTQPVASKERLWLYNMTFTNLNFHRQAGRDLCRWKIYLTNVCASASKRLDSLGGIQTSIGSDWVNSEAVPNLPGSIQKKISLQLFFAECHNSVVRMWNFSRLFFNLKSLSCQRHPLSVTLKRYPLRLSAYPYSSEVTDVISPLITPPLIGVIGLELDQHGESAE